MKKYGGGCHCGAVRFTVELEDTPVAHACNCSICEKLGYLHLIAPLTRFSLEQGEADLTTYTFNTGVAKHHFCRHCGIKSFYVPRSNPDGVSINMRCLDTQPPDAVIEPLDGKNWEQSAGRLAHLSKA